MSPYIADLIRGIVLFEIVVAIMFSIASSVLYIQRVRTGAKLSKHVLIIVAVFLTLCVDRLEWVWQRVETPDLSFRMIVYLIIFAASGAAQYLLYVRQIAHLNQGD